MWRSARPAGRHRLVRNHPAVVSDLRARLRPEVAARRGRLGDTWYLDEVFVTINGQRQYLWRASTRTATSSASSSNLGVINRRPGVSFGNCSPIKAARLAN